SWTADSLRGHVTLVVLWSDTDPGALQALPDAQAWHLAYRRYGLRVLGVHVPEFAFAADSQVVGRFARRLGLTFPIVNDASYRLVSRFRSEPERPAFYLADASGRVVFEGGGPHTHAVDHALRAALAGTRPRDGDPLEVTDGAWPPRAAAPDGEHMGC